MQTLDMQPLRCSSADDVLRLDTVLNQVFPLLPFLTTLVVHASTALSRRALYTFTYRDGVQNLRVLKGVQLMTSIRTDEDAFVELLRACTRLEELEVLGTGIDLAELQMPEDMFDSFHSTQNNNFLLDFLICLPELLICLRRCLSSTQTSALQVY